MGRPLNPRYFGTHKGHGVFVPVTRMHDSCQASMILSQTNKHAYFCRQVSSGVQGLCKLSDNLDSSGNMVIRFQDHLGSFHYASKITNLFVWDFLGKKYTWSFLPVTKNFSQYQVYIIDNSNNQ